jgi:hypothetical protein
VERLLALLRGRLIGAAVVGDHTTMTSAVYFREVLPVDEDLLWHRRLRPLFLVEAFDARAVSEPELYEVDPQLASLGDCNAPEAYRDALRTVGLEGEGM